jgi:hypothetical protein
MLHKSKTICGNNPVIGGKFWYKSKYMDIPLEGIIAHVSSDSIISTKGVNYYLELITVEPLSDLREKKINSLLGEDNI